MQPHVSQGIDSKHPMKGMGGRKRGNPGISHIMDRSSGFGMEGPMFDEGGMGMMMENRNRQSAMSTGINDKIMESINNIEKDSSKIACECNHGLMVEALKKVMFTKAE